VQIIGNDGTTTYDEVYFTVNKPYPIMNIESPASNSYLTDEIGGWTLNKSGVKEVNAYIDNLLIGSTTTGLYRSDVYNVYPQFGDSYSGYYYSIGSNPISPGAHTLKMVAVGNDGETAIATRTVTKAYPLIGLESPSTNHYYTGNCTVSGWALNASGIKEIDILSDGTKIGQTTTNISRPDIISQYNNQGQYNLNAQSPSCGYSYTINSDALGSGSHVITVQAVGNDGMVVNQSSTNVYCGNDLNELTNNMMSGATLITNPGGVIMVSGNYIYSSSDVDYFKISKPSDQDFLEVKISDPLVSNTYLQYTVSLYNPSGNLLATLKSTNGQDYVRCKVSIAGTYYIKVSGDSGNFNAQTPYTLTVQ
jgi:hypothetical protein